MLTKLKVRNFKQFGNVEIELGNPVVFIGPNNSGKTTALQALALWELGLRRWNEKRAGRTAPEKRPGVTVNRRDLAFVPTPDASLLWRDAHVRDVQIVDGAQKTKNVRIDVVVEGVTNDRAWECGFEFDYANPESFYCRPLRLADSPDAGRMAVPDEAARVRVNLLPPMSGLADREFLKTKGEIDFLIGQGRTAEVVRNLAYQLQQSGGNERYDAVRARIQRLFGVQLGPPRFVEERSEITMSYREQSESEFDLSSGGRGFHQTLLLLLYMAANPGAVLLLDEPDAHLEILRQRQIYQTLSEAARDHGSQVIAASHSEVILNEAADRDVVVAFVGTPHRIDDRGNQLAKSLKEIGFEQYYQAEQKGWVLYVEGATDLAILQSFASVLGHPAEACLERPFVHYIQNLPPKARSHFYGLREAKHDLVGAVITDRLDRDPSPGDAKLREFMWQRREIENYLCQSETLLAFATASGAEAAAGPLFAPAEVDRRHSAMINGIDALIPKIARDNPADPWWLNTKASDDFLDRLFEMFYDTLGLPNLMRKTDYHVLAQFVPKHLIDADIVRALDMIVDVASSAHPLAER